jgi:hypothetical protein
MLFLANVESVFVNPTLAVALVFLHNVIVVSLIIIGMSFYVDFVHTFLPKRKIDYVVLDHPRLFAAIFTIMVLIISILKVNAFFKGKIAIDLTGMIMLITLPHGVVEAYGIYTSINKTLSRKLTNKGLAGIYLLFLLAAILEVGFFQALKWYVTNQLF